MEDALSRMEAGADPESLEKEMDDIDEKDLFKLGESNGGSGTKNKKSRKSPFRDDSLYEM